MQFKFTETQNPAPFEFGGRLAIKAETPQEVESLVSAFRLFPDMSNPDNLRARIEALESGSLTHTIGKDSRPVYEIYGCLDIEFTAPYQEWAARNFGYTGVFPDLEIPRKRDGLIHTNFQRRLYTVGEHIAFEVYVAAAPWAGKTAHAYAESLALDYVGEEFGTRYQESEFVQKGNGQYYKNPDYLKRHKAKPGATNARLKRAFFEWWKARHANPAQLAIIEGNAGIVKNTGEYMGAFNFEKYDSQIYYAHTGADYKSVSFAEFAKLEG